MRDFIHLRARVLNTPLFISQSKLEMISDAVLLPAFTGVGEINTVFDTSVKLQEREQFAQKTVSNPNKDLAVINVYDTLQAKGGFGGLSGFTTYESIRGNLQNAVDTGYKDILLNIDSPGGEVVGLFALTTYIRSLVASGINITSYVDGSATSAAYAIAAATSARYATNTSFLGSIAAIMVHMETSKADATAGKTYTIFRSKEEKALGDTHTALTDEVKGKFQAILDSMDTMFNNDVLASMPQLSLQSILDMKGSEFMAAEALQLGLIDKIVSGADSAIELALQKKTKTTTSTKTPKGVKMNEDELRTMLLQAQTEVATLKAEAATNVKLAIDTERARSLSILTAAKSLNIGMDTAIKHITKGFEADTSLEILTEIAEATSSATMLEGAVITATLDPDLDSKIGKDANLSAEDRLTSLRAGAIVAGFKLKQGVN